MAQVAVDQPRIAHHAAPDIIGHQPAGLAQEQGHAKHLLHLAQRLGRPGLGDGHRLGRFVHRAATVELHEQAQLAQAQAGKEGIQGRDHGQTRHSCRECRSL
ncbi:hypothetical protein D3C79_910960 [compost metagenome]